MALGPGVGSLRWACTFHALGDANSTRRKPGFWWNMGLSCRFRIQDSGRISDKRSFFVLFLSHSCLGRKLVSMTRG